MSDGKASLDPGITGIIVDSELKVIKSIPGYNVDYGSLVGGSDPYIGEHTRVRAPRTKHKEKGIPGLVFLFIGSLYRGLCCDVVIRAVVIYEV